MKMAEKDGSNLKKELCGGVNLEEDHLGFNSFTLEAG